MTKVITAWYWAGVYPTRWRSDSMPMGKTISGRCCFTISIRYTKHIGPLMAWYGFADWDSCLILIYFLGDFFLFNLSNDNFVYNKFHNNLLILELCLACISPCSQCCDVKPCSQLLHTFPAPLSYMGHSSIKQRKPCVQWWHLSTYVLPASGLLWQLQQPVASDAWLIPCQLLHPPMSCMSDGMHPYFKCADSCKVVWNCGNDSQDVVAMMWVTCTCRMWLQVFTLWGCAPME